MGIVTSMPLPNRGYTGTITMMTGLITELAAKLAGWLFKKSSSDKKQTLYLTNNLIAYFLGALLQTAHSFYEGVVRAWPLILVPLILSYWAYKYGFTETKLTTA